MLSISRGGSLPVSSYRVLDSRDFKYKGFNMSIISGNGSNNNLYGTNNADTIYGFGGDDYILAGGGNDRIIGGTGQDEMWGMAGNDTYVISSGDGDDLIYSYEGSGGFSGSDVIEFSNISSTQIQVYRPEVDVHQLSYSGGTLTIVSSGIRQIQFSDNVTWQVSHNAEVDNSVVATGYNPLDGLLSGTQYVSGDGARLTLSYGFPDYTGTGETDDDITLNTASTNYQTAVREQLATLSTIINVDFIEVTNPQAARLADMSFAGMVLPASSSLAGYAYYPGASDVVILDDASSDFSVGGEFYQVLLHEIGHKLGLKHTFEESGDFAALEVPLDQVQYTVMTYNWDYLNAQSYSILDIQALQHLYGANMTATSGEDTYYVDLSDGSTVYESLWDAGGSKDMIRLVGNGVTFSLQEGAINTTTDGLGIYSIAYGTVIENITGTTGADFLIGNDAGNIINGLSGNDVMVGGLGDDVYIVNQSADVIVEYESEGIDIIRSAISYTISDNVEKMILTGTKDLEATGNSQNNKFIGNSGDNIISGLYGNDVIYAGAGEDTLYGGKGHDKLVGGSGNDLMIGDSGRDTFYGQQGDDVLVGGTGNDQYKFRRTEDADTIIEDDLTAGNTDLLLLGADIASDQLWFSQEGQDLKVSIIGTSDQVLIQDWYQGAAHHVEQIISGDGLTLLDNHVQSLVDAMSGLTPPAMGETELSASLHAQLDGVIAASWA